MKKEHILNEIRRTAVGGKPLGRDQFCAQTGIREHEWLGKYWAKWSDAHIEAGLEPLSFNMRREDELILECVAELTMRLGRVPTAPEMRLERRSNSEFPNDRVIGRRWNRRELIERLAKFCRTNAKYAPVVAMLDSTPRSLRKSDDACEEESRNNRGYVYLIRAQGAYKIGCSRAPYRRAAEIANQSATGAELLHKIETDDPEGIEDYWHRRFSNKKLEGLNKRSGEWFALSSDDLKAFMRRKKFM